MDDEDGPESSERRFLFLCRFTVACWLDNVDSGSRTSLTDRRKSRAEHDVQRRQHNSRSFQVFALLPVRFCRVRCRDFCDRVNVPVKDFSPHLQKTTWESRNGMHLRWPSCLRRPAQVPNTMDFQGRLCKYVLSLRSFWKPFFHVMQKSAWVCWSKVFSGRGFFLYFLVDSPPERLCPEPDACSGNVLPQHLVLATGEQIVGYGLEF